MLKLLHPKDLRRTIFRTSDMGTLFCSACTLFVMCWGSCSFFEPQKTMWYVLEKTASLYHFLESKISSYTFKNVVSGGKMHVSIGFREQTLKFHI